MDQPGNHFKNLAVGMKVEINPQHDRSREKRAEGIVAKLLTKSPQHSHLSRP